MKFEAALDGHCEQAIIKYLSGEYSLDTYPLVEGSDFDLALNTLNLSVVDQCVVQIWGYLGNVKTNPSKLGEPNFRAGKLKVLDEFEWGFSYRINSTTLPVHFDEYAGWICIGDQKPQQTGVEFIKNCVGFLDQDGSLSSLWIKPVFVDE